MPSKSLLLLVSLCLCACGEGAAGPSEEADFDSGADTPVDALADDALAEDALASDSDVESGVDAEGRDANDTEDTALEDGSEVALAPYSRAYTDARTHSAPEGFTWARSIVHLHSTHSHDACDGEPRTEEGGYNLPCMHSLRDALCEVRIDVAWLTDHPTHMTEVDAFEDLLLYVPEVDTLVRDEASLPYANWIACDNGHRTLVRVGAETAALMPVGLRSHLAADVETRQTLVNAYTPEAAAVMREHGALVWAAHTEGRSAEDLRRVGVDGVEIYQLHANIDPRIREHELGLDPMGPVVALAPMLFGQSAAEPDLAFLVFAGTNQPSLDTWGMLLKEGPVVGTGGTDAHENSFPMEMQDGERLDSYRRMMAWFSNYVLVRGALGPDAAQEALGAGRVMVVFDVLGLADGLDFSLQIDGERFEMGSSPSAGETMVLQGSVPTPLGPSGIEAPVRTLIWRMGETTWEEVAEFGAGAFTYALSEAGVYRVEVLVEASHLSPYMAELSEYGEREIAWVLTNAWRVGLDE